MYLNICSHIWSLRLTHLVLEMWWTTPTAGSQLQVDSKSKKGLPSEHIQDLSNFDRKSQENASYAIKFLLLQIILCSGYLEEQFCQYLEDETRWSTNFQKSSTSNIWSEKNSWPCLIVEWWPDPNFCRLFFKWRVVREGVWDIFSWSLDFSFVNGTGWMVNWPPFHIWKLIMYCTVS